MILIHPKPPQKKGEWKRNELNLSGIFYATFFVKLSSNGTFPECPIFEQVNLFDGQMWINDGHWTIQCRNELKKKLFWECCYLIFGRFCNATNWKLNTQNFVLNKWWTIQSHKENLKLYCKNLRTSKGKTRKIINERKLHFFRGFKRELVLMFSI